MSRVSYMDLVQNSQAILLMFFIEKENTFFWSSIAICIHLSYHFKLLLSKSVFHDLDIFDKYRLITSYNFTIAF